MAKVILETEEQFREAISVLAQDAVRKDEVIAEQGKLIRDKDRQIGLQQRLLDSHEYRIAEGERKVARLERLLPKEAFNDVN
jgi:hypothetical protein